MTSNLSTGATILEAARVFEPSFSRESMRNLVRELAGHTREECEVALDLLVATGSLVREPGRRKSRYLLPALDGPRLPMGAQPGKYAAWHAMHFLARAQSLRPELAGAGCAEALDGIQDEVGNLARAFEYLLAEGFVDGAATIALTVAAASAVRALEVDQCAMLDCVRDSASRKVTVEVLVELSVCRQFAGEWEESTTLAQRAVGLAAGCHDPGLYSLALRRLGTLLHWRGKSEPALDCFGEAEILAKRAGDVLATATCMYLRGVTYFQIGDLESAGFSFLRAEDIARGRKAPRLLAQVLGYRANVDRRRGDYAGAMEVNCEAESIAREIGDGLSVIHSLRNQGILYRQQGHLSMATERFEAAEVLARSLDNKVELSSILTNRATILGDNGRYLEALDCFRESEALHRELGYAMGIATCLSNRGAIHLELGEYDQALACIDEADEIHRATCELRGLCTNCLNRGAIHEKTGQLDEAVESYVLTAALATETGDRIYVALAHAGHGRVLHTQGELEEARDQLRTAARIFDELGFHQNLDYVRCQGMLAETEAALGDPVAAASIARATFQGLKDREESDDRLGRDMQQALQALRAYHDPDAGRASG